MVAIHDDDLVIVDEVEVSAPIRIVLDQHRRHFHDPNRCRHDRANRDGEVDARHPRRITTAQHSLAHLGLLFDCQGLMLATLCVIALCIISLTALSVVAITPLRVISLVPLSSIVTLAFALRLAALLLLDFLLALLLLGFLLALLLLARTLMLLSLSALLRAILATFALLRGLLALLSLVLLRLCGGGTAFATRTLLLRALGRGENRARKQDRRRGGENRTYSHFESPVDVSPHRRRKHTRRMNVPLRSAATRCRVQT